MHTCSTCGHPQQLAMVLGLPPDTPWEQSIAEVSRLVNRRDALRRQAQAPPSPRPATTKLFKSSEVPAFTDLNKYWEWRRLFQRFALCHEVDPAQIGQALYRILLRFEGTETSLLAQNLDFLKLIHTSNNWTQTCTTFVEACDKYCPRPTSFQSRLQ
jgi:hypothetical protein